jgi:hypothetical protein
LLRSTPENRPRRCLWLAPLFLVAVLLAAGVWLLRDGQLRPAERASLYAGVAGWLRDHSLPDETVAAQETALLERLANRPVVALPRDGPSSDLLAVLQQAQPDYCLALNSLAWQEVRYQPWFRERYQPVYQTGSPYDTATPLTLFRYTPSPFDAGEVVSLTVRFAADDEQVTLEGYRLGEHRLTPGEPLHLTLYWRTAPLSEPLRAEVRLVDAETGRVHTIIQNAAPGGLPTDRWNPGALLADRYTVGVPADLPEGDAVLDLALYRPSGQPLAPPDGAERFTLARLSRPPAVSAAPLTPDHPLSITFEGGIELLGYDLTGHVPPGGSVRVALYWRATRPIPLDYKVFVHLLGPDGQVLAQSDAMPVGWTYPTSRWQPGETVRDEHLFAVDSATPRGDYWLAVGLYDPQTGERLPARDQHGDDLADQRVMLQQVQVR